MYQHLEYAGDNSIFCLKVWLGVVIYTPVNTLRKECRANDKGECKLQRVLNMHPLQQNTNHQESGDLLPQSRQ